MMKKTFDTDKINNFNSNTMVGHIGIEIFIKQRYNSGLNSDRILAPAITKLLKNFRT